MVDFPERLTFKEIASITDHTFLKTEDAFTNDMFGSIEGRRNAFDEFLDQTALFRPYAICVRPYDVGKAKSFMIMNKLDVKIASVAGFPDPYNYIRMNEDIIIRDIIKDEIREAFAEGAKEIDFVMPHASKSMPLKFVERYVKNIGYSIKEMGMTSKLILEISNLSPQEIKDACIMADKAELDFVKTSTGYSNSGANIACLEIMRDNFPRGIKISGGVTKDNYVSMLRAALGNTSSISPNIIRIGASSLLPSLYSNESR